MTPRLASFATAVCLLCASTVALAAEATSNPQDANAVNEVLVRGTAPALPTSSPTTALAPAVNPELFRIGFHPTAKAVRFFVANPPKDAKTWRVVLAAKDGNALAQDSGTLPFPAAGRTIKCDALAAAGKYTLTLTLDGGEPLAIVKTFERIKFDWEGNDLGRQDILVPPFTEVVATGKAMTVDCILRKHTIDTSGFWSQVTSEDKPLLAGPMRLEVQAGGKTFTASGGGAKFTSSSTTAAAGTATWQAGPLAGSTDFSFDYDGACEFRLHLGPTEQPIDHLRLVIPMNAAEASLMHPVTTLLRSHYAGAIPAGEGKVWDSQKISRHQLPAPFVPYIWVGGPERGICWYADNDQGCITDPNAPAMEIIRDGPAVVLVVNLVTRPARIAAPRTLSFGLQATPAKPMPQQPYNWRRWWPVGTARNEADVDFNLWGASGYWGARSFVTDFWPAGRDYSFFDQLAKGRRTGKVDKGFLEQWLEKYAANTKPEDYANLKAHWNAGLSWAPINPWDDPNNAKRHWVMPYTSARSMAACPEFATYLDEWSICDVADPRWDAMRKGRLRPVREQPNGVWYEVDPVGTYVDMILAFHKKMYDTFADGIYWDNVFLQANYVPQDVGGPAYIDDDGRLRPGVNLRAFRSLARRNAIMMQQMGRQQKQDPWYIIEELKRDFEVKQVNMDLDKIDDEVKVLMVIHPKEITDKAQFAIDQFIMRGGKLIAFLDAMSMVDSRGNNPMMQMPGGGSTLDKLIKAWGITFDNTKVVADHNLMWRGVNQQGAPDVQPAVLALTKKAINADDSATAQMDNVMMLFAGSFGGEPVSGLKKTVLLQSTADSQLIDGMTAQFSAQKIVEDFKSSGTKQALAIRLAGKFKTAFPDGRPDDKKDDADKKDEKKEDKKAGLLTECKQDNAVVLVGDADMLYDAFCVQVQNVFGQKIAIPRNSNLNLAQNLVEEMAGDSNLIGTRSRGTLNRPFTVVREMQAKAERKWQDELGKLEKQHQEVQTKISELQAKKEGSQRFILSKEQQEEITKLRTEQAKAGKRLKEVRKELRQDIDSLETRLKWLNIISIPVAVAIVGIVFAVIRNKRRSAK